MKRDLATTPIFGLMPGEGVPMERHGEMGILYRPQNNLTGDEMVLYGRVCCECEARQISAREDVVRLAEEIAEATVPDASARAAMIQHVMARDDEIQSVDWEHLRQ